MGGNMETLTASRGIAIQGVVGAVGEMTMEEGLGAIRQLRHHPRQAPSQEAMERLQGRRLQGLGPVVAGPRPPRSSGRVTGPVPVAATPTLRSGIVQATARLSSVHLSAAPSAPSSVSVVIQHEGPAWYQRLVPGGCVHTVKRQADVRQTSTDGMNLTWTGKCSLSACAPGASATVVEHPSQAVEEVGGGGASGGGGGGRGGGRDGGGGRGRGRVEAAPQGGPPGQHE